MIHTKIKTPVLLLSLKLLISAAAIIFLFDFIGSRDLAGSFKTADSYLIVAAFALMFFNIYLQYLRWKTACGYLLNERDSKKILLSLFHGFPAGAVTPGRIGEYFARGLILPENSKSRIALSVFVEKLFPLIPVFAIGLLSFFAFLEAKPVIIFMSMLMLTVSALAVFKVLRKGIPENIRVRGKIKNLLIRKINEGFSVLSGLERKFVIKMILVSILFYLCYIIQYALLVSAFSGNFFLVKYMWAGSLLFFIKAFIPPVAYGDLGIREGVSVYFITRIGETAAAGLNASLFLFIINLLIPSLAGTALLFSSKHVNK